jgi:DNA-binding NarL/FixJ family response regulator
LVAQLTEIVQLNTRLFHNCLDDITDEKAAFPLRVASVEDDVTTREGLAALIGGRPGYRCVGRYGSVEELLRKPPDRAADVVLLDINLPGISGGEGVRLVRKRWSSTEVLMLR